MIYSALTNTEIERWVRNSPHDHLAKIELLKRTPRIINLTDNYVAELEQQIEMLEEELKEARSIYQGYEDV